MCPRLFTIGSFSLPTYGLLVVAGLLVGLLIAGRLGRRVGINPDHVTNLGVYLALSAIVGAKLFMILTDWGYYLEHRSRIFSFATLRAGGVFYGGLLAALATAFWFSRKYGLRPLQTADVFAPAVAIGHSIGRLGCFAAGCCWGKPSSVPWAMAFTDPAAPGLRRGAAQHPSAPDPALRSGGDLVDRACSALALREATSAGSNCRSLPCPLLGVPVRRRVLASRSGAKLSFRRPH